MKKKLLLMLGIGVLLFPFGVNAGNADVSITGKTEARVGETIEILINVSNIQDTTGVVSFGGGLKFDDKILKFMSVECAKQPYEFYINENIYRLAGLDFTLENGIKEETNVYKFKFMVIGSGKTTITLENLELTDSNNYIDTDIKTLNLVAKNKITTTTTKRITTTTTTKITKKITKSTNKTTTTKVVKTALKTPKKKQNIFVKIIVNITNFFTNLEKIFK